MHIFGCPSCCCLRAPGSVYMSLVTTYMFARSCLHMHKFARRRVRLVAVVLGIEVASRNDTDCVWYTHHCAVFFL